MFKGDNNNISFSIFSHQEIDNSGFINEINQLIKKYNILENENQLISSRDKNYLYIINYVLNLNKENKKIPLDIETLFLNNISLKEDINNYLEKKLNSLTTDTNTYFLKGLNLLLFISTIGSNESILDSSFEFDFDAIARVFRFFEEHLKYLFLENVTLFDITFNTYIILLKSLIQLCTIRSIDLIRKNDIKDVIESITESVNIIKFTIELTDAQLSSINNIQGKYLYIFTHLEEIDIHEDDLNSSFIKFILEFSKQEDGFLLSKNNHFGFEKNSDYSNEFLLFKNYSAIFILKLIKKLRFVEKEKYTTNPFFRKILSIYYKRFSQTDHIEVPKSFELIEKELLSSVLLNYKSNLNFEESRNYRFVIEDFIISDKNFNDENLEVIYRLLYFASDLDDFKYAHISQILIQREIIKNTYHEFFKLAIFDLFIKKVKDSKISQDTYELLLKIIDYTMQNVFDSYLHSICSKIFVNIGFIFANNEIFPKNVKDLYAIFLLLNEDEIIHNIYLKQIIKISLFLEIPKHNIRTEFLYTFFKEKSLSIENDLEKSIKTNYTKDEIIKIVKKSLSEKLFFFTCKIDILENNNSFILNNELESLDMIINPKYMIKFSFTKQNEQFFNFIFVISKDFIKEILEKLLKESYTMNANFYLDEEDDHYDLLF